MGYCEECLKQGVYNKAQMHHIIHRSVAPYMKHIEINFKDLCLEHHTGSKGVHHNPDKDRQYKEELQLKLQLLFTKDYYDFKEIKKLLNCSDNSAKAITKTLIRCKEGYRSSDLIRHMLGDRNYL